MNPLASLPTWAAVSVTALVLASAVLALIGSIGLLRLKSFYSRLHAPTLGSTLGMFLMVAATVLAFSLWQHQLALSALLIGLFVTLTTPITMLLLARAALARDRAEGSTEVPAVPTTQATDADKS